MRRAVWKIRILGCAMSIFAACSLGSCQSSSKPIQGPTAAQAGATLKTHITSLVQQLGTKNLKVTDPGQSLPCGSKRAKQTYAVTGNDTSLSNSKPTTLVDFMTGFLVAQENPYKVVAARHDIAWSKLANTTAHVQIAVSSPSPRKFSISGQTECLRIA